MITYVLPVRVQPSGGPRRELEAQTEAAQVLDERAVLRVGEPLGDRRRAVGTDPVDLLDLLGRRVEQPVDFSKCRARFCAVTQPTSGMFRPKSTRLNEICFDASIDATAFEAEISP